MIIYLDTSAFVKLVIDEDGADLARRWFEEASLATSSVITFPEACSALARRARRTGVDDGRLDEWLSELDARWTRTAHVRVDERVAGRLAIEHSLRGMDAVQLGAAVAVRERAWPDRGPRSSGGGVRPAAARGRRARGLRHARRPARFLT